jgi:hypothetical protein
MSNITTIHRGLHAAQTTMAVGNSNKILTTTGYPNFPKSQSITLTGSVSSIGSTWHDDLKVPRNKHITHLSGLSSTVDMLAISVAWKRLRDSNEATVSSLLDESLFDAVTPEDLTLAESIRIYYQQKLIKLRLLDNMKLSKFRADLSIYINGPGTTFNESDLPMIYRLPEFYEYDISLDHIKQGVKMHMPIKSNFGANNNFTKTLIPIKYLTRSVKKVKIHEYWLKDEQDFLHLIAIGHDNALQHIWDKEFSKEILSIQAFFSLANQDDFQYFKPLKWKLL